MRENSPEQLRRSLDASRVLAALGDLAGAVGCPAGHLRSSPRARLPAGSSHREGVPAADAAALGGRHRRAVPGGPAAGRRRHRRWSWPACSIPTRSTGSRRSSGPCSRPAASAGDGRAWLARYLDAVAPAAHPAAASVTGSPSRPTPRTRCWPSTTAGPPRFVVRDLEGVSLNRDHPRPATSSRRWYRRRQPGSLRRSRGLAALRYYVLVNHLGQLIATLAEHLGPSEAELWSVAGARSDRRSRPPRHRPGRCAVAPPARRRRASGQGQPHQRAAGSRRASGLGRRPEPPAVPAPA